MPPYTATDEQVGETRPESTARYGIPYAEAERNVKETQANHRQPAGLERVVSELIDSQQFALYLLDWDVIERYGAEEMPQKSDERLRPGSVIL
jgi:hypothetical protein